MTNNNPPCFLQTPDKKQKVGPYTFHQVYQYYAAKKITENHLMSLDRNSWHKVGEVFASQDAMRHFIQTQQATVFTEDNIVIPQEEDNNLDSFCALFESEPEKIDTLIASSVENKGDGVFGDYEILGELGRGGMGVVYKAKHKFTEKVVALKVLLTEDSSEKEIKRFIREAKLTTALKHRNIVATFNYGEDPAPYISMEYVEGQTLSDFLKRKKGKLSQREATKLFLQICEGVAHAHEQKVIHRDLKPGNILIDKQGVIKVMDFGLAKEFRFKEDEVLSVKGELIGTPQYMSPEQASTKQVLDHRSDVYSLGAIFYEMLCGQPPFKGEGNTLSLLFKILREKIQPLKEIKPDINENLHLITMKCLEKARETRYRRIKLLVQDLKDFLNNKPISLKPPGRLKKIVIKIREEKKLVVIMAVISIILIFLAMAYTARKHYKVQAEFTQRIAEFHNRNFHGDFSKCIDQIVDQKNYLWMQVCSDLIKKNYVSANNNLNRLWDENPNVKGIEKNKLTLLRVICAMLLKNETLAKQYLSKFSMKKPKSEVMEINEFSKTKFKIATYREFLVSERDATDQGYLSAQSLLDEKARYYLLIALLPNTQSKDAYERLFFEDFINIQIRDLYRKYESIRYLLNKQQEWVTDLSQSEISFLEMPDLIQEIKGVWVLDMRSPYWSHLTVKTQGNYAKYYQQAYANSIKKKTTQSKNIKNCVFEFALIPPGYFRIGDPHSTFEDGPAFDHYKTTHFWMLQHEVTHKQWDSILGKSKRLNVKDKNAFYLKISDNTPITNFSFTKLQEFIKKMEKERIFLPNEFEWEYCCRSGTTTKWFWKRYGKQARSEPQHISYVGEEALKNKAKLIRFKRNEKPNYWFLYEMSGNAMEICSNIYTDYRYVIDNGSFMPETLDRDESFSYKGGHIYIDSLEHCSSSYRGNRTRRQLERKSFMLGFRLLMKD
ncbi:protein kinase [Candidatus Uabimicrobium sp. HlEnr_7]|uniref:protein kinase domain-containing protein n=1 Tax=Candidatus Uabimicrobium helgolandensis TaxID=3095367 RepID=UPI0035585A06